MKAASHAKVLGTDVVGGIRRCTYQLRARMWQFTGEILRFGALREVGADVNQMVRAVASPSILYSVECFGISCAALQAVRSKAAVASSAKAGGKNVDMVWAVIDGASGTADPAFEAHCGPVKYWALEWWENWFPHQDIESVLEKAKAKLDVNGKSVWARVAGPATALTATLKRLNWKWVRADTVMDDVGNEWVFGLDAPKTFAAAVHASVRRWRLKRIAKLFPQLLPDRPDVHTDPSTPTILIDMFGVVSPLVKGKAREANMTTRWNNSWAGDLASAMNGGQWPQTRKAKVASWNITDDRCQLCFAEPGTLQHRHRCAATAEARCSIPPPKEAQFAHTKFNDDRLQLLQLRAVAVVKVPAPKPRTVGSFCWLVDPFLADHDQLHNATWYTDGSMLMGKWAPLRCTGFGVVVVSQCGALLGYGYGSPPSRITTAAAAELWAVDFVLALNPCAPMIKTDCMSIITAARRGTECVTDASRPLARLWRSIADSLDDDVGALVEQGALTWIPAHLTIRAVGERKLPNGQRLTMVDWRANRLVDILAKAGAKKFAPADTVMKMLTSAAVLAKH